MSQQAVNEINLTIKEARAKIDLAACVERLDRNRDFKKLILEEYMKGEAVRLVHLKSEPGLQHEKSQAGIDRDICAIGSFNQFLNKVAMEGREAEEAIKANEEALADLAAEEAEA